MKVEGHISGIGRFICRDQRMGGTQEAQSSIIWGKQVIIMGMGIGVMEGISGGLGNLPWGCRHWGRLLSHLKGPIFWNLPTLIVGIFLRGGGMEETELFPCPFPTMWRGLLVFSPHFESLDFFLSGPRAPSPPYPPEVMGWEILDLPPSSSQCPALLASIFGLYPCLSSPQISDHCHL